MEKTQKLKEQKLKENIFKIKTAHWVVFVYIIKKSEYNKLYINTMYWQCIENDI